MTETTDLRQGCPDCERYCIHDEKLRLRLQADALDPITTMLLLDLVGDSVTEVLEVGTGAGTIVTHFRAAMPGARIWTADVQTRPEYAHLVEAYDDHRLLDCVRPADGSTEKTLSCFDVIHVRCVLSCVPDREAVLDRLCSRLAPQGVVLIEEFTGLPPHDESSPVGVALAAVSSLMTTALGADLRWTAQMPRWLEARGLARVGAHAQMHTLTPGSALTRFWQLTLDKWETFLLEHRALTREQISDARRQLAASPLWELSLPMISSWGYRL
ncbi:class I SAM-dependent methyltransferase [Amycolatopsis sp. NPDC004378]